MAVKKAGESKVKKVVGGIACGLALILVGGVCGGLLQHHYNWGAEEKPPVEETPGGEEKPEDSGGGEVSTEAGVSHGIRLAAVKLASSEYEDYGVSPLAETAYTLTATITPADAANKAVDWTIAFKNASSTWATGKTVTDYVTVMPTSEGSLTARVECKAAFGTQIVVTVTSRENRSASATCTADYQQRLLGYGFWFGNELNGEEAKNYFAPSSDSAEEEVLTQAVKASFNTPTTTEAGYSVKLSETYTKPISEADYTPANYFEIEATEQFKDYITNVAKFDASQLPKWTSTDTEYESRRRLSAFFDENWGAALHGGEAAKRNALINALLRFGEEPAYRIRLLDRPNGTEAAVFTLVINPELLANQLQAESIKIDQSGVTF